MTPHYADEHLSVYLGDCLEVMPTLADASVDAVVTDPPYDLTGHRWDSLGTGPDPKQTAHQKGRGGFMGKTWDGTGIAFRPETWAECFRLLKPGGHLLAFGGTRTVHRLASAIEDAGFEIRDCLVWGYAAGFPKSLDVGKAIDRAAGAEREVTRRHVQAQAERLRVNDSVLTNTTLGWQHDLTAPATDDAKRWDGWGTALKPAWEPIVMARKPLQGTVAANVLRHGVGALNISATRIGNGDSIGRWPPNLLLSDPIFDGDTPGVVGGGEALSAGLYRSPDGLKEMGARGGDTNDGLLEDLHDGRRDNRYAGDTGTYSRFFLIPKEARNGREPAVRGQIGDPNDSLTRTLASDRATSEESGQPDGLRPRRAPIRSRLSTDFSALSARHSGDTDHREVSDRSARLSRENVHPTVKPLELMRHLVRLVTPPGGLILDPFLGSGTTALAAINEGFRCIGIEREAEYVAITMARLHGTQAGMGLDTPLVSTRKPSLNKPVEWKSDGGGSLSGEGINARKAGAIRKGYDAHLMPESKPKPIDPTASIWGDEE